MSETKNALSRWSQRKAAVRRGEIDDEPAAPAPEPEATAEPAAATAPARTEDMPPESEVPPLPSIDSLDAQSDYTVFLGKNVPEALRTAALRKLWASDPAFSVLDGLNDYDDDYNLISDAISLVQASFRPALGDEIEKKINETLAGARGGVDSHRGRPEPGEAAGEDEREETAAAADASADASPQPDSEAADPAAAQSIKASSQ